VILYDLPQSVVLLYLFVFGAAIGSFMNVCIYRLPQHVSIFDAWKGLSSPPSACPFCKTRIRFSDNVPIFGWIKLGGRCHTCRHKISFRYPAIELFNGLLFVLLYWLEVPADWQSTMQDSAMYTAIGPHGISGSDWLSPIAVLHWRYLYHLVLVEMLVVATFIDFDLTIIPDSVTAPAAAVGILGGWISGQMHLVPLWTQSPSILRTFEVVLPESLHPLLTGPRVPEWFQHYPHTHGLLVSIAGLIVGGGAIWMVRIVGNWVLKQEAMGFGDVTLMAAIGTFIGWQAVLVVFFIAPVCALTIVALSFFFKRSREIPYGPYLSMATLIVLFNWSKVWNVAERIFDLGPILPFMGLFMAVMLFVTLYLMQGVKKLLGIPLYQDDWYEEWTSADQLAFYAGENRDQQQGNWRKTNWQGTDSGRGLAQEETWRRNSQNHPNQQLGNREPR